MARPRAAFHFLTTTEEISAYISIARKALADYMTIGTFSDAGPKKCTGLNIRRYNKNELQQQLEGGFQKIKCVTEDHKTPFGTTQNFLFCSFKRHNEAYC